MATAQTITKSQAIRDYYADHPGAMPKEVGTVLNAKYGWDLTRQMIGSVKHQMLLKQKRKASKRAGRGGLKAKNGRRRGRRAASQPTAATISLADLMAAKDLAARLGSIDAAKRAVDLLKKLS